MRNAAAPREHLTTMIEPVVTAAGFDLEEVVVTPAGRRSLVRVVVDADSGITLDDIAMVSRAVSDVLDDSGDGLGATPYVLEVSSPGVDRPLTQPRHWRRATGRLVRVGLVPSDDGAAALEGRVLRTNDTCVVLDVAGSEVELELSRVRTARVEIEFKRPSGGEAE